MPPTTINRSMNTREWTMLLVLALLWGCSFFFAAVALRELPPLTIVFLRVLLASLTLLAAIAIMGIAMPRDGRSWWAFCQMAILNNVIPFVLLVWGQTRVASGVASILIATTPIFTTILAHYVTSDEKITVLRAVGVFFGVAGVVVMLGTAGLSSFGGNFLGELAILGAAVSYAASSVYARRFNKLGISPLASATGLLITGSVLIFPIMLVTDHPWTLPLPGVTVILAVLGFAVLSTAIAYIFYFKIVATAGATNLMLVTFLMPVTAILLGVIVLDETLEPRHIAGMALIAVGLIAIDGRLLRGLRRREAQPAE
ncbi:MAG TPA: DMT family transporter [Xanthobacteraceae bacterium]|nr:DMT family transporter [Xanthobacteraceae bacterium]